jgi:hypothetical protein
LTDGDPKGTVPDRMRYDDFRDAWHRAFSRTRLFTTLGEPTETLDLRSMERRSETLLEGATRVEPFTISARLAWRWGAIHAARTRTTEEDFLRDVLGEVGEVGDVAALETERPWLRVDVSLTALAHLDARLQLPEPASWKRWVLEIGAQMDAHLSHDMDARGAFLGWRGDPTVELRCGEGGQLFLTGVELTAWRALFLPRIWDHPERARDPEVGPQLEDLARRVGGALEVWTGALATLATHAQVH